MTETSRIIDRMSIAELEMMAACDPLFVIPPECTKARKLASELLQKREEMRAVRMKELYDREVA